MDSKVTIQEDIICEEKYKNSAFECLNLENTVEIGKSSFMDCHNLKTVNFPDTLQKICQDAFAGCQKLENIKLHNIRHIRPCAFYNCTSLKKVDIKNVRNIEFNVFGFSTIDDLKIEQSQVEHAFEKATLTNVEIKDSVICDFLFSSSGHLKYVKMEDTELERGTFSNCNELESVILCGNIQSIPEYTFDNCANLKEIHFPLSLKRIDSKNIIDKWHPGSKNELVIHYEGSKKQLLDIYGIEHFMNVNGLSFDNFVFNDVMGIDSLISKNKSFKEINDFYKSFER